MHEHWQQRLAAGPAKNSSAVVASKPVKLKRSMMPHRPVAIELADTRVVAPGAGKALDMTKVKHLFGVRRTSKGVLFVQPLSMGRRLEIAGDFNGWTPALTMMTTNEALGRVRKTLRASQRGL